MTTPGVVLLDLIGLVLLLWMLDQVRRNRLYVGYGVLFALAIIAGTLVLSVPPLRDLVTRLAISVLPGSALTLLALCFTIFMLIYVLTQVTLLSNRLASLIQRLAIEKAQMKGHLDTADGRSAPRHHDSPRPND